MARHVLGYAGVSGLCLVIHNLLMIGSDAIGATLPLAVFSSYLVVVVTGYVLHSLISFRRKMHAMALLRYALAMSVNIPLAIATTWIWTSPVGLPMHWAAPIATLCMIVINYLLSHWAIGRRAQVRWR
ncbi:MAG: GtrA family protein [Alphaproteobacteria bacterium]|nr:GtrA family protein [Alphaproteobacteria bacterium]MCW5740266.1 GtrA family protein [Alphaproteobacteria bacterium]